MRQVGVVASRPRGALAPVASQHQAANAPALERVQLRHQFGIERHAPVVEQRHPVLLVYLLVQYAHRVRPLLRPIVRDVEGGEDIALALQPLPRDQCSGGE